MIISFYLFRVAWGQCAALQLPEDGWLFFDLGSSPNFSPILWVASTFGTFSCPRLTLSHWHYNHLADYLNLFRYPVQAVRFAELDQKHLEACFASCRRTTARIHLLGCWEMAQLRERAGPFSYYRGILIRDQQIPLELSRRVSQNSRAGVNNTGLVTRIEIYGRVILIPGDLQQEVWTPILNLDQGEGVAWQELLRNVDILLAPYHGQPSGFSPTLLALTRPKLVLIPATQNFPVADRRYYQLPIPDCGRFSPVLSTAQHGHLRLDFHPPILPELPGLLTWSAAIDQPPPLLSFKS